MQLDHLFHSVPVSLSEHNLCRAGTLARTTFKTTFVHLHTVTSRLITQRDHVSAQPLF
jgi:hypothetical protein